MSDVGTVTEPQQEGSSKVLVEERDVAVAVTAAELAREVGLTTPSRG